MKYLAFSSILSILAKDAAVVSAGEKLTPAGQPDYPAHVTAVNYTDIEGTLLQGFLADRHDDEQHNMEKTPAVIILHDADGPDLYEQQRATIIANDLGYIGFAADIFGLLTEKPDPDAGWSERSGFVGQFTGNATLFSLRIQAAINYVSSLDEVDSSKIAIMGYCLGGTGVVHYLNNHHKFDLGNHIQAAIGVHPTLQEWPSPDDSSGHIPALFLTGGSDFLTGPAAMARLEGDMKTGTAGMDTPWESIRYANIGHAFSNWMSEGSYDERADARSWHSALTFLKQEFGERDYATESLPPGPVFQVDTVKYADAMDGDYPLTGYASIPAYMSAPKLPVVVIIPHKMVKGQGADVYEKQRATEVADMGYIGFVADVYSHDLEETSAEDLEAMYHEDIEKYISRVTAAVEHVKSITEVDPTQIAVIGFGFGGSGALYYGMSEKVDAAVKAIASFHGELAHVADSVAVESTPGDSAAAWPTGGGAASWPTDGGGDSASWNNTDGGDSSASWNNTEGGDSASWNGRAMEEDGMANMTQPQILIQSGVEDDDMEAVIALEQAMIAMNMDYELTRFSDTHEEFTIWSDETGTYNPRASIRSFDQLATVLDEVFVVTPGPAPEGGTGPSPSPTPNSSVSAGLARGMLGLAIAAMTLSLL